MGRQFLLYGLFFFYNILYGVVTVFILFSTLIYLNGIFNSVSLKVDSKSLTNSLGSSNFIPYIVLILGGFLFMFTLFILNKAILIRMKITTNYKSLAKRTTYVVSILPFLLIMICLYLFLMKWQG